MAKKLVLVPEDMYRGLMSSSSARESKYSRTINNKGVRSRDDVERDGHINLEFTRKNMIKARDNKGKSKNVSAKNTAYNQELRRYLRFRKEMNEKPIKVKLSNGANVVVKGANGQDDTQMESALLNENGDLETTLAPNSEPSRIFAASSGIKANPYETPKSSRRLSSRIEKKKKSTKSELPSLKNKQLLLRYLYANSEKLGLTKKGQVLRRIGGLPIKTSNLELIVEHLLDASGPGSSSPPGTSILRSRLAKDLTFNKLMLKEGGSKELRENELRDTGQYGKGYYLSASSEAREAARKSSGLSGSGSSDSTVRYRSK